VRKFQRDGARLGGRLRQVTLVDAGNELIEGLLERRVRAAPRREAGERERRTSSSCVRQEAKASRKNLDLARVEAAASAIHVDY
jgi:hypothetical protein